MNLLIERRSFAATSEMANLSYSGHTTIECSKRQYAEIFRNN